MRPLSWKRKLLFGLVTFLFFLALAEVALRVFDLTRGASVHARASWFWGFEQDRLLDIRAKPNVNITYPGGVQKMDTNAEGFRDVDIPIEPQRERRLIICIGESSTWGTQCSDHTHTYPRLLQEELKQAFPEESFVVMNAGFPAYTLVHNVQLLQLRLLKYKPEAILCMGLHNDCDFYATSLENEGDYNRYPRRLANLPDTWVNRVLMQSSLFSFLAHRVSSRSGHLLDYQAIVPQDAGMVTSRGETLFRDQIALMKLLCQRHAIKLIWVDQVIDPSKVTEERLKMYESVRAILHDELRRQDIPLLQANDRYDHAAVPMADEVHFTDLGNAQLAKLLAPQLANLLQTRASPKPAGRSLGGDQK